MVVALGRLGLPVALLVWASASAELAAAASQRRGFRRLAKQPKREIQLDASPEIAPVAAKDSRTYLIASFPELRQVAYCHLPDNVWRPLVIGRVEKPTGVAVDGQASRLFVADPPNEVIWWYTLRRRPDGLLETNGQRLAAVEGVVARWITVNTVGDVYFTGRLVNSTEQYDSVFRHDVQKLVRGISIGPTLVYSRENTGSIARAYAPSGIAVDSLYVYWGNQEEGTTHGSVVKGSGIYGGSQLQGATSGEDRRLTLLSNATEEVRGMAATGSHIFYITPTGVYGLLKTPQQPVTDPEFGLMSTGPPGSNASNWSPTNIAWDGATTLYLADDQGGEIFTLPAVNTLQHSLAKHSDAPGVHSLAVVGFTRVPREARGGAAAGATLTAAPLLLAIAATAAAAAR